MHIYLHIYCIMGNLPLILKPKSLPVLKKQEIQRKTKDEEKLEAYKRRDTERKEKEYVKMKSTLSAEKQLTIRAKKTIM